MRNIYIVFVTLGLFISGCVESFVEYQLDYDGDRIVIVGMLAHTGEGKILVRKSLHPQDPQGDDMLYNANVDLYQNGEYYTGLIESQTGEFILPSGVSINPGKAYYLVVNAEGFPEAETIPQILPPSVCFDTVFFETKYAKYCFTDPMDTTNYYAIKMLEYFKGSDVTEKIQEFINPYDVFTEADYSEQICYFREIYGHKKYYVANNEFYDSLAKDSVVLKLVNLSEGIYQYSNSVKDYEYTRGDPFFDLAPIYSNVSGGYGIFGMYSYCDYGLKLTE